MARSRWSDYLAAIAILAAVSGYSLVYGRRRRSCVAQVGGDSLGAGGNQLTGLTIVALVILYRRARARFGRWREGRTHNRSAADFSERFKK